MGNPLGGADRRVVGLTLRTRNQEPKTKNKQLLAVSAAALLLTGCATIPMMDRFLIGVSVGDPFIIVQTEDASGWGVLTHPYLCRISDRRILLTYNMVGDVTRGGGVAQADWPAYTDDGGQTWQFGDPYLWADGRPSHVTEAKKGQRMAHFYGYCFGQVKTTGGVRIAQTRIARPPKVGLPHQSSRIWSSDGSFWFGPTSVVYNLPEPYTGLLILSPKGLLSTNGSIYCVAGSKSFRTRRAVKYATLLMESADGGYTFDLRACIAQPTNAPWGNNGPSEPAVARAANGDLICMMRTGSQSAQGGSAGSSEMLMGRSTDDGATWTLRRMNRPGVMPKLLRMSNGVLVCAFGRPGNNLMFSLDNGETWIREIALTPPDIKTSGYLDLIEVEPGRLLVIYDMVNTPPASTWLWEPPPPICAVWGVFVDVKM